EVDSAEEYGEDEDDVFRTDAPAFSQQEEEDDNEVDERVLEGVAELGHIPDDQDEDKEEGDQEQVRPNSPKVAISDLKKDDDVVEHLWSDVDAVLKDVAPFLCRLWEAVKKLAPTRRMMKESWASWVDILAKTNKGRGSTKEA
ncbi:unnamed protein product, partial [Hapterophycus canaliculatus]